MEFHLENAAGHIENSVQIVQAAIFEAAEKSISNKTVIIRLNDHPWITCRIKSPIRKRKRLYKKFKKTNNFHHWVKFKATRNKVVKVVRLSKKEYFDKLETTLNTAKPSSKLFWKTSKQILKLNKSAQSVRTLIYNNETTESKKKSNDQEPIQSDPTSCPQNQKGNN